MGVAAADYDNDGLTDLFVAGVHQNQLLRNTGDGGFEDVTAAGRHRRRRLGGRWAAGATTTTTADSTSWS